MSFPIPRTPGSPPAEKPPVVMPPTTKLRLRQAAVKAKQLYPGPVGEILAREILSWEELGYLFSRGGLMAMLVDHLMGDEGAVTE